MAKLVKESADDLVYMAESDIISAKVLYTETYYPADLKNSIICFHATQAVEKLLKGYLISNNKEVGTIHNLNDLNGVAAKIDGSFLNIREHCALLNNLIPSIKYKAKKSITKENMDKIIKSLESICNFPLIKTMRDSFGKKHSYEIVAEIIVNSSDGG